MKAQNRYYEDPDIAKGFNNISSAILGSARGDAAYELANKRRAEAAQQSLLLEAIEGAKNNPALARQMLGKMEYDTEGISDDAVSNFAVRTYAGDNPDNFIAGFQRAAKTPYEINTEKQKGFKEREAGLLSQAKRIPLENQEAAIQSAIQSKKLQSLAAEMVGLSPEEVRATPEGMESIDFIDSTGPMGSGLPQDMDQITRAVLMSGTKSGAGIGGALSAYRHQQEIQQIELEKEQVEKEIVDTKALIQNSKLTEQQYKEGAAQLAKLQKMHEMLTAEANNKKAITNAEIAQSNLAVTQAAEAGKIEIAENNLDKSKIELKSAEENASFESNEIKNKKELSRLRKKILNNQLEKSEQEVITARNKADTSFSVFMEQVEGRSTQGKIGEQKVKKVTSEAEIAGIKKDIAEIEKSYEEELKPLKLQYQENKNQLVSEEITTEQTLRYFNANKLKASTKAILDRLAASLDISAQDLLKATSQAEKASTEAQSAKDLAPGLKAIQKSKIQQADSKAKLFAQELQQALKMDPVKFQKLMEQVDLIREQITGQTIENSILEKKESLATIMLSLEEQEQLLMNEILEKESQNASLKNIETQQDILIKQAPKNQKAVSKNIPVWGAKEINFWNEQQLAKEEQYIDPKNGKAWTTIPENVRGHFRDDYRTIASNVYQDENSDGYKNMEAATDVASKEMLYGVVTVVDEDTFPDSDIGIPRREYIGFRSLIRQGKEVEARAALSEIGYNSRQIELFEKAVRKGR